MKYILIMAFAFSLFSIDISAQECASEDNIYEFYIKGRRYELVAERQNWLDATYCAEKRGGYFVDIESKEENDAIFAFLIDSLKKKYNIDLVKEGNTTIWLGGFAYIINSTPAEILWYWGDIPYNNDYTVFTRQIERDNQRDLILVEDDIYQNWGLINNQNGNFYFPTDKENLLNNCVAMNLDKKYTQPNNQLIADEGQWVNLHVQEQHYFIIDYGCVDEINVSIDTTICEGNKLILGGQEITEAGEYKIITQSYSDCDSTINAIVSFTSFDKELDRKSDKLQSKELQADSYQWYRCDTETPIDGATKFSYNISETGDYRLELEKSGCKFVTDCYFYCFPTTFTIDTVKCANDVLVFNDIEYSKRGFYTQTLNQEGFDCDSTVEIDIEDITIDKGLKLIDDRLISSENQGEYQWYNCAGDVLIADATQKEYYPTEDGDYKVEITKQGCIDYSECFSYSKAINSVNDISESEYIRIDKSNKQIIFDIQKYDEIELIDINSKTIYKTDQTIQSINIDYLNSGVYFLKITNNNKVEMFKFMVVE